MRRITAVPRLAPLNSAEILPGAAATSDSDLRACVRGQGQRIYHPVGSCKKWAPIPWPSSTRACECAVLRTFAPDRGSRWREIEIGELPAVRAL